MKIVALAVDNEAVMNAFAARVVAALPWILHIPCGAHAIQLALKKTFDEQPLLGAQHMFP